MNNGHYQIRMEDVEKLKSAVETLNRKLTGETVKVVIVKSTDDKFDDDFLHVWNRLPSAVMDLFDRRRIIQKLRGKPRDKERNNVFVDFGFAGKHNSRRDARYRGLTHSEMLAGTTEAWVKETFVATTTCLERLFPNLDIYSDELRNRFWAKLIDLSNKVEALRLGETNCYAALLALHWDIGNCVTEKYAWVATILVEQEWEGNF